MQWFSVFTSKGQETDGILHDFVWGGHSCAGLGYYVHLAFNFSNETLICLFDRLVI